MQDPSISGPLDTPTAQFIIAARFLKTNAPHSFQIREMGAQPENLMDRWLWDFLS